MNDIIQLDENNRCVSANCIYKDDDKTIEYEFDNEDERMNFFNNIENYEYNEESKMIDKIVFEVWAKLDANKCIERIESTAFFSTDELEELGMIKIDEGTDGQIYGHAQPNYLKMKYGKTMYDEQMLPNFKYDDEVKEVEPTEKEEWFINPQRIAQEKTNQETMLQTMMMRAQQVAFLVELPDEEAVKVVYCYDSWDSFSNGYTFKVDTRLEYKGNLWKVKKEHKKQADWYPGADPTLFIQIDKDEHEGTLEDPIPVPSSVTTSGFEYVKGKYYLEDGLKYKMIRDGMEDGETITLYYPPSQLLTSYFELV